MELLQPIELNEATGEAKALLDGLQQRLGRVPNMLRLLGHSPTVLGSYLDLTDAFNSQLSERLRTLITITVAQVTGALFTFIATHSRARGADDGVRRRRDASCGVARDSHPVSTIR